MTEKTNSLIDLAQAESRLRRWRSLHNTPEKVAVEHRKALLERVSQSMAFNNQPVTTDRLKTRLTILKPSRTRIDSRI